MSDNFGPEDVTPTAYLDKFDTDDYVSKFGHDPESPLALLVRAIIAAQPKSKKDDEKRFRQAFSALSGKTLTKKRADDYDALLKMAWLYHCEKHERPNEEPVLNHLAEKVFGEAQSVYRGVKENVIKTMVRNFKQDKLLLLARATSQNDWNRMDEVRELKKIADQLDNVGVPTDKKAIRPRLMSRDFSTDS